MGVLAETSQYDAYGKAIVFGGPGLDATWFTGDDALLSLSAVNNPYLYTAQRFDPETRLNYYKNRYHSSELGRFISRDPAGGVNLYTYVRNHVTGSTDAMGLIDCDLLSDLVKLMEVIKEAVEAGIKEGSGGGGGGGTDGGGGGTGGSSLKDWTGSKGTPGETFSSGAKVVPPSEGRGGPTGGDGGGNTTRPGSLYRDSDEKSGAGGKSGDDQGLVQSYFSGFIGSLAKQYDSVIDFYSGNLSSAINKSGQAIIQNTGGGTVANSLYWGGVGVSAAGVATAGSVGTYEFVALGNQSIMVEGVLGGGRMSSGGLVQLRVPGQSPIVRFDYHPFPGSGGNPLPHIDSPPLGWHHWPWQ
jgi:RHS repeat-associated protein